MISIMLSWELDDVFLFFKGGSIISRYEPILKHRILFRNYLALVGPDSASKMNFKTVSQLSAAVASSDVQTFVSGGVSDERTSVNVTTTLYLSILRAIVHIQLCRFPHEVLLSLITFFMNDP